MSKKEEGQCQTVPPDSSGGQKCSIEVSISTRHQKETKEFGILWSKESNLRFFGAVGLALSLEEEV